MGKVVELTQDNSKLSDWELFWEIYPKKKSKGDAFRAWKQTENVRPSMEEIIAALQTQSRSMDWQRDGGQWVPYPASWLRAWMWADED